MLYFRTINLRYKPCRLLVAQMAERSCNALLQREGIAAFFEHFGVVVRLDDDVVGSTDVVFHHIVEHTDVGGYGKRMALEVKAISQCSSPIVHDGESLYRDAEQPEGLHGLDFMEKSVVGAFGCLALGEAKKAVGMGINRSRTVFRKLFQTQHMVDMVVRDEDGFHTFRPYVVPRQMLLDLLRADAHIDKQALVLLSNIIAVAAAPAGEAAKHERRKA